MKWEKNNKDKWVGLAVDGTGNCEEDSAIGFVVAALFLS